MESMDLDFGMAKKILIVDDEPKILGIVREMLQREGYEAIVADSGSICLEILENVKPDLIIMDVMMPHMDGWEVVEKIKSDESNKGIPICMLTVRSKEEDMVKSLNEVGADWHISKPVERQKLLDAVNWLL
jgi:DNA-binding response OmpR family regulator